MVSITRRNPRTGHIERPWRNRDGLFVLGDPAHGAQKHHDKFAVKVGTLAEAAALVRRGFSLRMTDGESPPSLISPDSLTLEEVEGEDEAALWAETAPKPLFGKEEMFAELKRILLVYANQIAHAGSPQAALAFIGFDTGSFFPYCDDDPEKVELHRFSATSYLDQAYDYAFQVGNHWKFDNDMATDVSEFLAGAPRQASDGMPSPITHPDGLCRHAAEMAFARWKLGDGQDLTVRELALLADMKEAAVRNSLSKERIALEDGKVDTATARQWLNGRRDFIPTRTEEAISQSWAVRSRFLLDHEPFAEAFGRILKGFDITAAELAARAEVGEEFVHELLEGRPRTDLQALERIGRALDLDAPHFVGAAVQAALRGGR
ncbi:hypothetical protein OL599_17020 [Rhodovastum sp. RN2-1]|uniref:Uncharacterized protein n=2 Tax=Limobrevibacterium gyesilva TaxID=2991712 RepID=A0AA41YQ82_9PROT|nr:hypothetical protein [Limobrevibacterium gyesilva]